MKLNCKENTNMKYLVQAILFDGDSERVVDSIKTDDVNATLEFVMKRHKSNYHYKYFSMEIATQEVTEHKNKFQW